MNFEDFETKARLYVLGALDEEEFAEFERTREELGERAEKVIADCQRLSAAFALSLRPTPPRANTRERLLSMIEQTLGQRRSRDEADPRSRSPGGGDHLQQRTVF